MQNMWWFSRGLNRQSIGTKIRDKEKAILFEDNKSSCMDARASPCQESAES
jgi:hypothetical protein